MSQPRVIYHKDKRWQKIRSQGRLPTIEHVCLSRKCIKSRVSPFRCVERDCFCFLSLNGRGRGRKPLPVVCSPLVVQVDIDWLNPDN